METEEIIALSESIIAFVTIIGLMVGFYYNLKTSNTGIWYIILFESSFVIAISLFASWVRGEMK